MSTGTLAPPRAAPSRVPTWWWAVVALPAVVFGATRLAGIQVGLWWDEAFTAHRYVRGGPSTWLDPDAYVANNHLLFTAVTWVSTRVTGTSEPWLRLWAIVPATVAVVVLVAWLWRRRGPSVATVALALTTVSALALAMSIQARGYGLVILAATVLLVVPTEQDRAPTIGGDGLVAIAGVVAMTTFPPTVALYLAHAGVWLLRRRVARVRLVVLTALAGAVTAATYLPLFDLLFERADRVGSRFADPITWWSPVLAPLQLVGGPGFGLGRGEVPVWSLPAVAALVLGLVGLAVAIGRDRPLGLHLVAGLGGSVVLLAPAGFHLADRYISFLLPHAVTATAIGVVALLGRLAGSASDGEATIRSRTLVAGFVVVLTAASLPGLWWSATIPLQAFAPAAQEIRSRPEATVVVDSYHTGYQWYLDGIEVQRVTDQDELDDLLCTPESDIVFARHPDFPILEVPDCLGPEHELRFTHQRDPGYLSLYVVEAAASDA